MNQILRCDWLPERARWSYLARSGLPARRVPQEKFPRKPYNKSFIDQAFSVKMASYWPRSFFCELLHSSVSVHKHAKKELGQYPAILTSHLVNNPYISIDEYLNWPVGCGCQAFFRPVFNAHFASTPLVRLLSYSLNKVSIITRKLAANVQPSTFYIQCHTRKITFILHLKLILESLWKLWEKLPV